MANYPPMIDNAQTEDAAENQGLSFAELNQQYHEAMDAIEKDWLSDIAKRDDKRKSRNQGPIYSSPELKMAALRNYMRRQSSKWMTDHGINVRKRSRAPKPDNGKPNPTPKPDEGNPTPTPKPDDGNPTPTPKPDDDGKPTPTPKPDDGKPTPTPKPDDGKPTPTPKPDNGKRFQNIKNVVTSVYRPFSEENSRGGMDRRAAALITLAAAVTFLFMYDTGLFRAMVHEMNQGTGV
jgi:hypothetical protein